MKSGWEKGVHKAQLADRMKDVPLAVVSAEALPERPGVRTFQYKQLLGAQDQDCLLRELGSAWWVCFECIPGIANAEVALSGFFSRILENRSNVIIAGNPGGMAIQRAGKLIEHAPRAWDSLPRYVIEACTLGLRRIFSPFLITKEMEEFFNHLGRTTPSGSRLHHMVQTKKRRSLKSFNLLQIVRTDEPVASLFLLRRGGSISFFPFVNIPQSIQTALVLRDFVALAVPESKDDGEEMERFPLHDSFPRSSLPTVPAHRGANKSYSVTVAQGGKGKFTHNRTFTHVTWNGEDIPLNPVRALALEILHEAYVRRQSAVEQSVVLEAIRDKFKNSNFLYLHVLFKGTGLWGKGGVIMKVKRNLYSLVMKRPCCPFRR